MTRLILAAGVAALAITAPASAKPGNGGGGAQFAQQREQRAERPQRAQRAPRMAAPRVERSQRFSAPRMERRQSAASFQRQERRVERARPQRSERVQTRSAERRAVRPSRADRIDRAQTRVTERQRVRSNRVERVQNRAVERGQARANRVERVQNRVAQRQELRANRNERVQNRVANRQELRANRVEQAQNRLPNRQELRANRVERRQDRIIARNALRNERLDRVRAFQPLPARFATDRTRIRPFGDTVRFVGRPVRDVNRFVTLAAVPSSVAYLYADTPDWYYRYGGGYIYRIDRRDDVIDWLFPLIAGGFLPGQYLPSYYMSSYVPSYYGFNSFYPSYGNVCTRYGYGVVYEVDCFTGAIFDVIPTYAGGYGVGQLLPSAYSYYNVPFQYRSLYYDTPDYGYWYAPGAIYQYDRDSALITSVAALMSPGFAVGQPLPVGYGVYNVPYAYRTTYYDTPNAWYRYNNGYIYQVDPSSLLVTAAVASILT